MLPRKGRIEKHWTKGECGWWWSLAAKSSWLPAIPGHCVRFIREQRAHSVNTRLLFPGLVSLCLRVSCFSDHMGCSRMLCEASRSLYTITQEQATYLITNEKCENAWIYLAVFTWSPPLNPPLIPGLGAANEERTFPHASAINAGEHGSVNFHTSHLKLSCFLHPWRQAGIQSAAALVLVMIRVRY